MTVRMAMLCLILRQSRPLVSLMEQEEVNSILLEKLRKNNWQHSWFVVSEAKS
ncbi:hypothetical protein D3C81_743890 [compost metagenome]